MLYVITMMNCSIAGNFLSAKHSADRILLEQLNAIQNPSLKEKLDRLLIKGAINAKLAFGMGLNEETDREKYAA